VDLLNKNPQDRQNLLEALQTNQRMEMVIGERTFRLSVNAVFDASGERLGNVIEWSDVTQQLIAERAAEQLASANMRIKIALDGSATNVMIADNDRNIIYANRAVIEMMSHIEADIKKTHRNFHPVDWLV